jgi:hypothetical protein
MKLAKGRRVLGVLLTVGAAATLAAGSAGATAARKNLLTNGSFETADFSGWTKSSPHPDHCPGTTAIWRVLPSPSSAWCYTGFDPDWPTSISAWKGKHFADVTWDADAKSTATLSQAVSIPKAKHVTLTWADNVSWDTGFGATKPRFEYVDVLNRHGSISSSHKIRTLKPDTEGATGWVTHTLDLSRYAARKVQIRFRLTIPEQATGPANFAIDAIRLSTS